MPTLRYIPLQQLKRIPSLAQAEVGSIIQLSICYDDPVIYIGMCFEVLFSGQRKRTRGIVLLDGPDAGSTVRREYLFFDVTNLVAIGVGKPSKKMLDKSSDFTERGGVIYEYLERKKEEETKYFISVVYHDTDNGNLIEFHVGLDGNAKGYGMGGINKENLVPLGVSVVIPNRRHSWGGTENIGLSSTSSHEPNSSNYEPQ